MREPLEKSGGSFYIQISTRMPLDKLNELMLDELNSVLKQFTEARKWKKPYKPLASPDTTII